MAINQRISSLSITRPPRIYAYEGSKDAFYLDETQYDPLTYDSVVISTEESDFGNESDFEAITPREKPELEDIEYIDSESFVYINESGVARAQIVFKVRNTSGKKLLGVDVLEKK